MPALGFAADFPMKRKIAAIFAADVAGYSRLVAEDEEETLRRLASYRSVMDDFIARAGGRIFNTAGDAVLAEFSSAVEAVRCAIDIQESLRTRNMAYPASRQMNFRIGITIGDVVERDGDLLGDGVNIAARLEGIAPVGGICISRTVHEQVANKLSVQFADIGEQQVKNIPNPVHAYQISMRPDDAQASAAARKSAKSTGVPIAIAAACVVLLSVSGLAYKALFQPGAPLATSQPASQQAAPAAAISAPAAQAPAVPAAAAPPGVPPQQAARQAEALVPETIPFIVDRARNVIRNEYMPAADHKALAISSGPMGFTTGQVDDETAKQAALDICQKRADALPQPRKCDIYAIGNMVVYARGRPPLPSPLFKNDPSVVKPVVAALVPLVPEQGKANIEKVYVPAREAKALAIGPRGGFFFDVNQENSDEAIRRSLESCGSNAGVPCLLLAINGSFVVPVPETMKVTGFFQPAGAVAIGPEQRPDITRRLAAGTGWTAVTAGSGAHAGVAVGAASEQDAVSGALADCAKQDSACRVIAIGPFTVEAR
jgi:class 3 adenylate cyclase